MTLQTTQVENVYLANLAVSVNQEKVFKMPQISIREIDMQRNTAVAYQLRIAKKF